MWVPWSPLQELELPAGKHQLWFRLPLRLLAGVAQAQFMCVGAKPGVKQKAKGGLTLPSSSLQVIIADDYSDPFDAKNDLKSKAGKGESAGYMEPYEAQRIMTGKQSSWHRDLQLSREVESPFLDTRGRSPAASAREGVCFPGDCWEAELCGSFTSLPVHGSPTSGRTRQGTEK